MCLAILILVFGPRITLLFAVAMTNWYDAFSSNIVAVLAWFFAPCTSLAWMLCYFQNDGVFEDWYAVLIFTAIVLDLLSLFSSSKKSRQ